VVRQLKGLRSALVAVAAVVVSLAVMGHETARVMTSDGLPAVFMATALCGYVVMSWSVPRRRRPTVGTVYRSGFALDNWPGVTPVGRVAR
jgi:hypothetical protein